MPGPNQNKPKYNNYQQNNNQPQQKKSVSSLKKIRDIERLLKRNTNLDEEASAGLRKKIEELKAAQEENIEKEKKRKHKSKYQMVKFFERKKVTRMIHRIINQLKKTPDESELEAKKKLLEDDLAYIMYYPIDMKYIALYADRERQSNEQDSVGDDKDTTHQEVRSTLTGKTLQLSEKARGLARAQREKEVSEGLEDKVVHAIEVELSGGKTATKPTTNQTNEKKNNTSNNNKNKTTNKKLQQNDEDEDDNESGEESEDDSDSDNSDSDSSDDDEEVKEQTKPAVNKKAPSAATAPVASNKKRLLEEQQPDKNANAKKAKSSKIDIPEVSKDTTTEGDGFFVEEATEADLTGPSLRELEHKKKYYQQIKSAVSKKKYQHHKGFQNAQHKKKNF